MPADEGEEVEEDIVLIQAESGDEVRDTVVFHEKSLQKTKVEAKNYSKTFVFNIDVKGSLHPQIFMKTNLKIDEEM